ncbi:unnamed protein product [Moneuplotes crassus]|uniref:Tim10-like domain-containing protein n=1 Tax=Euplotes crassus TaxID=5936 RepID=A0AAD1XYQ2_EUPCR|nr:unnamed protein product [Moneuplotes crassus]
MYKLNPKLSSEMKMKGHGIDSEDIGRYFDNEEQKNASTAQERMVKEMTHSNKEYQKALLGNWIGQVYDLCLDRCVLSMKTTSETGASDSEKFCSRNCFRKVDKALKMFKVREKQVNRLVQQEMGLTEQRKQEIETKSLRDMFDDDMMAGMTSRESPLINQHIQSQGERR